jgi:hypothetical protein
MRTVATLALLVVGASLSLAQNPAGAWKGKLNIKMPPLPASATPEQKAQYTKGKAQLAKAVLNLNLKANKTWTMTATGVPMGPGGNTQTGTWTVNGRTITLKQNPNPQNPNFTPPPQAATLAPNGKVLTITLPNNMGSIVFKR